MNRPQEDEALQPDERLRAALRHAPDAQREPPAAVTAHILATARAAAAQASAAPAASPAVAKRRPARGFGAWVLARPGFALGLVALVGAAALWGLQRPGDGRPVLPDPSLAQAPSAGAGSEPSAPLVVAQAEMAVPAAPAAPVAIQPEPTPVAAPRKNAAQARPQAQTRSQTQPRPEMHAAVPEILVMSPAPPPPAAFRPAPAPVQSAAVSPAVQPVVQPVEQVVVTASAARASQAPTTTTVAAADREPAVNPVRAWLAALPADEPAQRAWLLALADATEGRWQQGLPAAPILEMRAALAETRRERIRPPQSLAASAAGAAEDWSPPQIDGRRAQLRLLPQGLQWCEAGSCRFAPLSAEALQRLREQRPVPAAPREP